MTAEARNQICAFGGFEAKTEFNAKQRCVVKGIIGIYRRTVDLTLQPKKKEVFAECSAQQHDATMLIFVCFLSAHAISSLTFLLDKGVCNFSVSSAHCCAHGACSL